MQGFKNRLHCRLIAAILIAHDFIENSFYDMPVQITRKDKKYFLSPVHIQITIEE